MGNTVLNSYPIGAGKIIPVDHAGPASYTTGGETLGAVNNVTGISVVGLGTLDAVLGSGTLADSGNYWVIVQPTGRGSRKTFKLLWFTATAGVPSLSQAAAATNLSAETVRIAFVGR